MNPNDAIGFLEQAGNKCDCDAPSRRLLFTAVDLLKAELSRLAAYDANQGVPVKADEPAVG